MLTMTPNAAVAVKSVAAALELPETGGLRVSPKGDPPNVELAPAPRPAASDAVVEALGALLFVSPEAARSVDDKVLDAEVTAGEIRFAVRDG
jgi:iron-sulfur cluster assembly protein